MRRYFLLSTQHNNQVKSSQLNKLKIKKWSYPNRSARSQREWTVTELNHVLPSSNSLSWNVFFFVNDEECQWGNLLFYFQAWFVASVPAHFPLRWTFTLTKFISENKNAVAFTKYWKKDQLVIDEPNQTKKKRFCKFYILNMLFKRHPSKH